MRRRPRSPLRIRIGHAPRSLLLPGTLAGNDVGRRCPPDESARHRAGADRRIRVEPHRAVAGRIRLGLARSRGRRARRGRPRDRDVHANRDAAEVAGRSPPRHPRDRRGRPAARSARAATTTSSPTYLEASRQICTASPNATAATRPCATGRPTTSWAATRPSSATAGRARAFPCVAEGALRRSTR